MNTVLRRARAFAILVAALTAVTACGAGATESAPVSSTATAAPVASLANAEPVVQDCTTYPARTVSKPVKMLLACGDGGLWVRDIVWSSWGPDTAQGEGTQDRRICEPDCATGKVASGPTRITLRKRVENRFTEAEITDLNGAVETWPL
ncbi:hypothetical protein [Nocardia sp. NPDC057668]|uniref:hypothetical protein n=1 Tax=Nocardia sp. NPDC057668 TaxID=3346202 RepID=UPI0036703409